MGLLKNIVGSQAEKLSDVPDSLDEIVSLIGADHEGTIENPHIIEKTITFDVPEKWEKQMNRELKLAQRHLSQETETSSHSFLIIGAFIIWLLISIF